MIQNMKFRDVWAFVGQKGIKGFAEIEQVTDQLNTKHESKMYYIIINSYRKRTKKIKISSEYFSDFLTCLISSFAQKASY